MKIEGKTVKNFVSRPDFEDKILLLLEDSINASYISDKVLNTTKRSKIPYETVMRNSNLPEKERFALVENLLGSKFTEPQKNAIRKIHGPEDSIEKGISKGIYENGYPELRAMVEELDKAGFSREEGRKLMENGVLGKDLGLLDRLFLHISTPEY